MIYIVGINSFIAKNLYYKLKKNINDIILLSHNELEYLNENIKSTDTIINCCGVNKGDSETIFREGNFEFVKNIFSYINKSQPYFIHLSSLMVKGFKNQNFEDLPVFQKWFITSKLDGEKFLIDNYDNDKLCIIRPSNVFGYSCKPNYNNLLVTLVHEKIYNINKNKNINKNCFRNMISVELLNNKIIELIKNRTSGIINIMSINTLSLYDIIMKLYDNVIPVHIKITEDEPSIPNKDINNNNEFNEYLEEDFQKVIKTLEDNMKIYDELQNNVLIKKCNCLSQQRGDMVEITDLKSERLYKITLNQNSVRGNHFHYEQIEDFYINNGKVMFLFAFDTYSENEVIYMILSNKNELITIKPNIIHTLCNDFLNNIPDIFVSSTQKFIKNEIPDTKYINII